MHARRYAPSCLGKSEPARCAAADLLLASTPEERTSVVDTLMWNLVQPPHESPTTTDDRHVRYKPEDAISLAAKASVSRSWRTKTALFVGKCRYHGSQPRESLANPSSTHNRRSEANERIAEWIETLLGTEFQYLNDHRR